MKTLTTAKMRKIKLDGIIQDNGQHTSHLR